MQKFKPGDIVFSIKEGWVVLSHNPSSLRSRYPLKGSENHNYTEDGKYGVMDKHPSLLTYNPFETKSEFPKLMEVSDTGKTWVKRWVVADLTGLVSNNFPVTVSKANSDEPFKVTTTSYFKYCREIQEEEITILTMDEIATLIGKSVDKIQIKK